MKGNHNGSPSKVWAVTRDREVYEPAHDSHTVTTVIPAVTVLYSDRDLASQHVDGLAQAIRGDYRVRALPVHGALSTESILTETGPEPETATTTLSLDELNTLTGSLQFAWANGKLHVEHTEEAGTCIVDLKRSIRMAEGAITLPVTVCMDGDEEPARVEVNATQALLFAAQFGMRIRTELGRSFRITHE